MTEPNETGHETLMQALVSAAMHIPGMPASEVEPVWAMERGPEHPLVTEKDVLESSVEDFPLFFLTRNGKPVMIIRRKEGGQLELSALDLVYVGPPEADPERAYKEMEGL